MKQQAKKILSIPLTEGTFAQLDAFCAEANLSRAEVGRGLIDALLVDGKQFIFREWREQLSPACVRTREEIVFAALKEIGGSVGTRRLVAQLNGKLSRASVFRALDTLTKAGKIEKMDGRSIRWRPGAMYQVRAED